MNNIHVKQAPRFIELRRTKPGDIFRFQNDEAGSILYLVLDSNIREMVEKKLGYVIVARLTDGEIFYKDENHYVVCMKSAEFTEE